MTYQVCLVLTQFALFGLISFVGFSLVKRAFRDILNEYKKEMDDFASKLNQDIQNFNTKLESINFSTSQKLNNLYPHSNFERKVIVEDPVEDKLSGKKCKYLSLKRF